MATPTRLQARMSHVRLFLLQYARPDVLDSLIDTIESTDPRPHDAYILAKLIEVRKSL